MNCVLPGHMSIHYVGASKLGEFDRMEQQQGVLSYNLLFSEGCVQRLLLQKDNTNSQSITSILPQLS